jgi:hypothetical protein
MTAKKKGSAGKGRESQARGRSGPSSATPNERAQARKGKGGGGERGVPKVGKHDAGEGRSRSDGLH